MLYSSLKELHIFKQQINLYTAIALLVTAYVKFYLGTFWSRGANWSLRPLVTLK